MDALELFLCMALGVFRVARRYMGWFVGDIVADVWGIGGGGWSGVRPLGFRGRMGCAVSVFVAFCLGFLVGTGDMASGGCMTGSRLG